MSPLPNRPSVLGCTCLDPLKCPARGTYRYCPRTLEAADGKPSRRRNPSRKPGRIKRREQARR